MIRKNNLLILLLFISISCSVVREHEQKQQLSITTAELGTIGTANKSLLGNDFRQIGVPKLSKKVRVYAKALPFDKSTYKSYASLMKKSGQANTVILSDTLSDKNPVYIKFTITDLITMADALNASENHGLQTYLDNDNRYKMISAVTAVVPAQMHQQLINAEEIYLSQHGPNKLGLELIKDGKLHKKLNLASFTPFDYELSSFCWGKDNRNRNCIRAIVPGNSSCPKDTYKKAYKLDKKNDFRF